MDEHLRREDILENIRWLHKEKGFTVATPDPNGFTYAFGPTVHAVFLEDVLRLVNTLPAADVVEVRHERWEWGYRNGQYGIYCTGCGAGWVDSATAEWIAHEHDYCPKCGAKMDRRADADG